MKRKQRDCYEDGITLETDLVAAKYMNPRIVQVIQFFLMLLSIYGTTFSLLSGLEIEVDTGVIYTFMIISVSVYLLTYSTKRLGLLIHISLFGLYIYAGYVLWDRIKNGFWQLENNYIRHINEYYNSTLRLFRVDKYEASHVLNIFFIFFVIFLAFIICQAILGRLPIFIMFFTTLILIILPLAIGKIPDTVPFAAYVISLFGVMGLNSGLNFGKKHYFKFKKTAREKNFIRNKTLQYGIGLKAGLLLSITMILLFILLPVIFTPNFYKNHARVPEIKSNIQKSVMEYDASAITDFFSTGYFANISLFPSIQSTGGLSKGKLGRVATVKYSNRTALRVTVTGDREELYLKGYAGSVYDGNSWKEFDQATLDYYKDRTSLYSNKLVPVNLGSKIMELLNSKDSSVNGINKTFQMNYNLQTIKIHNVDTTVKAIYVPYFTNVPNSNKYDNNNESYVKTDTKIKDTEFTFYNVNNNILNIDWDQAYAKSANYWNRHVDENTEFNRVFNNLVEYYQYELINRDFAYNNYLEIPKQGMDRLKAALGDITYQSFKASAKDKALLRTVSYVREFIQKDTSYNLSPGVLPEGKDFVDYFLFENHKGYCTHYASSGAIVFRMLGIPARYVEGYVIKDSDFKYGKKIGSTSVQYRKDGKLSTTDKDIYELKIRDANAHAWVEIYVDGFGWAPVEMTPGYSQDEDMLTEGVSGDENLYEPTIAPTKIPTMGPEREEDEIGKRNNDKVNQGSTNQKLNDQLNKLVVIAICLIFICVVLVIISAIVRKGRIKKAAVKNASGKAIFYYAHLKRIFKYFNIESEKDDYQLISKQMNEHFEEINEVEFISYMELIKKAKYSNGVISRDELKRTQNFYNKVISYLYMKKPWYKKLYYRYIQLF